MIFVGSLYTQHLGPIRILLPSGKPITESYIFHLLPVATYHPSEMAA